MTKITRTSFYNIIEACFLLYISRFANLILKNILMQERK